MIFLVYPLVLLSSIAVITLGVIGLLIHRNPIRMLLSLEVSFNGVLLLLLYSGWVVGKPVFSSSLALFAIAISSSELALMVSIIMALFREGYMKTLDQNELEVEEEK